MTKVVLCSNCFKNQGLRLTAFNVGIDKKGLCPQCKTKNGRKLNKDLVITLAYRFFVRGTFQRTYFGGSPMIQFNKQQYNNSSIDVPKWLKDDIKLIEDTIKVGFFDYGPRMWMVGEIEPLKKLESKSERHKIITRILKEYPIKIFTKKEIIYRLRKEPKDPSNFDEYDSPPLENENLGKGRFDSTNFPVMYASQDLEICVHECRVTVEDELFLATLYPTRDLKLLDLTELIDEDEGVTEFESLDMAVHMLFTAGKHSYGITREIAFSACQARFDGLIFPSYFSFVRKGVMPFETVYGISIRKFPLYKNRAKSQIMPNVALFGRPIEEKIINVKCINRLVLNKAKYDIFFGPGDY